MGLIGPGAGIARAVTIYTVNTTADHVDLFGCDATDCTLREAINAANTNAGADEIDFNISGSGVQIISVGSQLPDITDPVTIAGGTQPGYSGSPLVEIDGTFAGLFASGLVIKGGSSTVDALRVVNFGGDGIWIQDDPFSTADGSNLIADSLIGTDGSNDLGNGGSGIDIQTANNTVDTDVVSGNDDAGVYINGGNASGNTVQFSKIGSSSDGLSDVGNGKQGVYVSIAPNNTINANTISGNDQDGVLIDGGAATGNSVRNNGIGVDISGASALGNSGNGVTVADGPGSGNHGNTVQTNIISSNGGDGVQIHDSSGNLVRGNLIGTDAGGTAPMGNGANGVRIRSSSDNNTIGGTTSFDRNVISANTTDGIFIVESNSNKVQGNYVGTDDAGTGALGNGATGVEVQYSSGTLVGGGVTGARNLIADNLNAGVQLDGGSGNFVRGNRIGTNVTGTAKLGSSNIGVSLLGSSSNTVGGTTATSRNLISGHDAYGINIISAVYGKGQNNNIQGNYIGTNAAGTAAIGNFFGVRIDGADQTGNLIGGQVAGARNLISGNKSDGVAITGGAFSNFVQGNYVGTNAAGTAALPNAGHGVRVAGGSQNAIGGSASGAGNTISGNKLDGVVILSSTSNTVQGNYLGVDAAGTGGLGNDAAGLELNGSTNNLVGGMVPAARNVISSNKGGNVTQSGLLLFSSSSNQILGNYVGTNAGGTAALPNQGFGILLSGSPNNDIGGTAPGSRNLVSGNSYVGMGLEVGSNGNTVRGNYVGTNAAGTAALGNGSAGFQVFAADNNTIGGTAPSARNVISGNNGFGIYIAGNPTLGDSTNNNVRGNYIGTNAAGTAALGSTGGVWINGSAQTGNTIGGGATGAGNLISGNGFVGVWIIGGAHGNLVLNNTIGTDAAGVSPLGNSAAGVSVGESSPQNVISGNSISSNGDLGIDLYPVGSPDGVTPNDLGDGDTGPNDLQNFPVLRSAVSAGGATTVTGTLNSHASTTYNVEVFANTQCDPSGNGEGQALVSTTTVTTGPGGNGPVADTFGPQVPPGQFLTSTAQDPSGNTSEFSACVPVAGGNGTSATGDFNGDGHDDLAVGAPGEDVSAIADAGGVNVFYGSATGLDPAGAQFWTQDSGTVLDTSEEGDRFGQALAVGDFDGDGFDDLAIGVPGENVGAIPIADAGAVNVLYGSASGLTDVGDQLLTQDTGTVLDAAEKGDSFGSALAAANFGGSTHADLAVGVPGEDLVKILDAGTVNVLYGSATGLTDAGNQLWDEASAAIGGVAPAAGDVFGSALATANMGNGGSGDLAVGIPGRDVSGAVDAGAVIVLYGSATGLTSTGSQFWSQDSGTVADASESFDNFGAALASGDFGGTLPAELAVGVPGEDLAPVANAGAVNVIYGAGTGLTDVGNQLWTQDTGTIQDAAETGDQFGLALAAANFGNGPQADLAVGVPLEDIPAKFLQIKDAGAVNVIYGGAAGLTDTNNQFWSQNTGTVSDVSEKGDQMGTALTGGEFGNGVQADLAVGVPFEDLGSAADAGAANVLYGTAAGLSDTINQFWNQFVGPDAVEAGDRFGSAMG